MISVSRQRLYLLVLLEKKLEPTMLFLSFIWLFLMILEFTMGLSPFFQSLSHFIWILFVLDFIIKISLAPQKMNFLKRNWLTALALMLPALRLFRVARLARLLRSTSSLRGLRLARVLTSVNRGIRALGRALGKRGFGYVMLLTILIALAGAAGIFAFENDQGSIQDYGTALWWTAMMLTTMGSDYFPKTSEGRILCLLLAIYGFAVFGYVTATVATFFVSEDNRQDPQLISKNDLHELQIQIQGLKNEIKNLERSLKKADSSQ